MNPEFFLRTVKATLRCSWKHVSTNVELWEEHTKCGLWVIKYGGIPSETTLLILAHCLHNPNESFKRKCLLWTLFDGQVNVKLEWSATHTWTISLVAALCFKNQLLSCRRLPRETAYCKLRPSSSICLLLHPKTIKSPNYLLNNGIIPLETRKRPSSTLSRTSHGCKRMPTWAPLWFSAEIHCYIQRFLYVFWHMILFAI